MVEGGVGEIEDAGEIAVQNGGAMRGGGIRQRRRKVLEEMIEQPGGDQPKATADQDVHTKLAQRLARLVEIATIAAASSKQIAPSKNGKRTAQRYNEGSRLERSGS